MVGFVGVVIEEPNCAVGEGAERRSNSFVPSVPDGGEDSARAVSCGRE